MKRQLFNQPRFWIFQATPERYDLQKNIVSGQEDRWTTGQYGNQIKPDDIAYFLQSGEDSGFYGWGYVTNVNPENTREISVVYQVNFSTPVPLSGLASDPDLQYISRLRFSQGTVFKLTSLEGQALKNYIRSMGLQVHEYDLPEELPISILDEYNLSATTTKLLNGAVQFRVEVVDISDVVTAFLQLLSERSTSSTRREDTITFLLRFINLDYLRKMLEDRMADRSVQVNPVENHSSNKLSGETGEISVFLNVMRMLQLAKEFAIRTMRSERIFIRHFLVALWSVTDLESILTGMVDDFEAFKKDLLNYLPKRYQKDNVGQWKEILMGTNVDATFQQFIARLNSDDSEGDDLLNIKPDVESLASVITAKDIGPATCDWSFW